VWRSPQWPGRVVGAQIFAVESVPADIEPCPLGDATKLQLNERVFVISHPLGGPLALSVRDTRLVAYEGFDVDYYAATELGSGGAPVFDDEWNIIAIHTRRIMPDGPKRGLSIRVKGIHGGQIARVCLFRGMNRGDVRRRSYAVALRGLFPIRFSGPEGQRLWVYNRTPTCRRSRLPERIECRASRLVRGTERQTYCAR
jgi:hypothetical protein